MSKEELLKEYVPKTENLLSNYKEYMAMIKNDDVGDIKRKHVAIQLKKVNTAMEVLSERDKMLIELRYLENLTHDKIAEVLLVNVSSVYRLKKKILKTITPIIFAYEFNFEI